MKPFPKCKSDLSGKTVVNPTVFSRVTVYLGKVKKVQNIVKWSKNFSTFQVFGIFDDGLNTSITFIKSVTSSFFQNIDETEGTKTIWLW